MMRFSSPKVAVLALPFTTLAVKLGDFKPYASNLPGPCEKLYEMQISGCSANDFQGPLCSKSCVLALNDLTSKVQFACGNEGIKGTNIIVSYLEGFGPQALCNNADAILGGGSGSSQSAETTQAALSTTAGSSPTSKAPSSSASLTPFTTLSGALSTSSASPTSSSTSSTIAVDTSSRPETAISEPSSTSSSSGSSETSANDHSGGGSPFDSSGNLSSASATLSTSYRTTLVVALLTMILARSLR